MKTILTQCVPFSGNQSDKVQQYLFTLKKQEVMSRSHKPEEAITINFKFF